MSERLLRDVRGLFDLAEQTCTDDETRAALARARARLDGPLRVAFAGKVKAGKSTLLNALVGEQLAPTDAGECTRIVSWFQKGLGYGVTIHPLEGPAVPTPFSRADGALHIDLGGRDPAEIDHLVIDWPSSSLAEMTLIDTPGIASLSEDVSERAMRFLAPEDERETDADAVIYLMRHLHASDRRFLEAFHDQAASQPSPVNTIGVLSRADEIGVGRLDAMVSASEIAARYRADPAIRRLCQTVLPVAGLIAEAGATMREDEYRALRTLADAPVDQVEALLISVDRFAQTPDAFGLIPMQREHLLGRFGLYGLRLSVALIRAGQADTARALAAQLSLYSGVDNLRTLLDTVFRERRSVLKARVALLALRNIVLRDPAAQGRLADELERVVAHAHEIAELRLLNHLRSASLGFDEHLADRLERVVGALGTTPQARLGLRADTGVDEVRTRAIATVHEWRTQLEHPLTTRHQKEALDVAIASVERLVADIT